MTHNIYLLRHGKVSGKAALYGVNDVDVLPEVNLAISHDLNSGKLAFEHVFSSPLKRCKSLAQCIYSLNIQADSSELLNDVNLIDGLQEMNFGIFDGVDFDEIYQNKLQWQMLEKFWQAPSENTLPQAEPISAFYQRVEKAWRHICNKIQAQKIPDQAVENNSLIVCHGGVIRMILANILKENIHQVGWYQRYSIPYGSLTHLTLSQGQVFIKNIAVPYSH